jgi:glutamate synthase (NADPH/NADH) large chain
MTGGRVVVIGDTGRNFAAGMSGGIAYVWNKSGDFPVRCNQDMVDLDPMDSEDVKIVAEMLRKHQEYTQSPVAAGLLKDWEKNAKQFVKIFPKDYKKALEDQKKAAVA